MTGKGMMVLFKTLFPELANDILKVYTDEKSFVRIIPKSTPNRKMIFRVGKDANEWSLATEKYEGERRKM